MQEEWKSGQVLSAAEIFGGRLLVLEGTGCPSASIDRGFCSAPPATGSAIAGSASGIALDPGEGVPCTFPFFGASLASLLGARIATSETCPSDGLCLPETIPGMFSNFFAYPHPSGEVPVACGSRQRPGFGLDGDKLGWGKVDKSRPGFPTRGPEKPGLLPQ